MLEVECCNRPEVIQKIEYMYRTHAASTAGENPKSFVLDTTITSQLAGKHDWRRRNGRPLESPNSVVNRLEGKNDKLTMIERNELWLAKKSIRTAEMKSREANSMMARAKTAPDISRSQRSFVRTSALAAKENDDTSRPKRPISRRNTVMPSSAGGARKNSTTNAVRGARRSTHTAIPSTKGSSAENPAVGVDRSLSNITNQSEREKRISTIKKKKHRSPIRDPFMQKTKSK